MANLDDATPQEGATRFGSERASIAGGVEITAPTEHDNPSYYALESTSSGGTKTVYYYWPDSNGVLRFGTSGPGSSGFDQDSSGTAV